MTTISVFARMPDDQQQLAEAIGRKLRALRKEKGFGDYRHFANQYEIEPKHYWQLEKGVVDFKLSSLLRVLAIHEISFQEFVRSL